MLHSLTRLVVGGVFVGYDGLRANLADWDARRQGPVETPAEAGTPAGSQAAPPQPPVQAASHPAPPPAAEESDRDRLRFALIGAVFSIQEQAGRGLKQAGRASRVVGNLAELFVGPVYNSRLLSPLRGRIDGLEARGRQEVDHWIELGRYEDEVSRGLARAALYERVDNAIEYLTANEEVQQLVQSQSAGLVDEVIEEARERTVSADNFLESLVRTMLRRPQRWELPDPPEEIKKQALPPLHQLPPKASGG